MKLVEVYFKNENDAESARAKIEKYNVRHVSIEKVPEGNDSQSFTPFLSPSWGSGGAGFPLRKQDPEENEANQADPKYMSHLLRFEVEENEYEDAIAVLKDYEAYNLKGNK